MKWFIVYMAYSSCGFSGVYNCPAGTYQAEMAMPSREVCEQIVKDNPNQSLQCWAKPTQPEGAK